ncbi:nibrin [Astyanax mexicanus]|uniref:nibrin n=1 Tax=Astyanax mexicanus TaxID=7994 RepID=UPI0020CB3F1D|nr:nibrin [Astyanax mexicanus]
MWILQPAESEPGTFYLLPGKEYVVGRKNCDILLANDQSISRVHAQLTVADQTVTLKDSSKYGTFVNDEQLTTNSTKTVHDGDRLTFGVFQSKFRLKLNSMVVCSSCVDNEGKAALSKAVQSVGGRLVNSWSPDCTHLVMPTVKVTIKTICALLCCRPIVKAEFFTELSRAVQRKEKVLPAAQNFKPEIDEPSLTKQDVDLDPRPERKSLFRDKTFVFLNVKQMKRLSQAITCGGGVTQLLEEGSLPLPLLQSTGTCVIDVGAGASQALVPPATKKWVDSVGQVLHRNGLRFIAESEIGLAAIYVSNQTYCNPCASPDSESVRARPAIAASTLSQNATVDETVLAGASQNITAYVVNTEPSQGLDRMDVGGPTAVGETPEKRSEQAKPLRATRPPSTSFRKPPPTMQPPAPRSPPEPKSSLSSTEEVKEKTKGESAPPERLSAPLKNSSSSLKKSPQKQSSLTSFFQPASKKRPREGSADSQLSEAKLSRREEEDEENQKKQISSTSRTPINSQTGQKLQSGSSQRSDFSASLGLGFGLGSGDPVPDQNLDSSLLSNSKKRKEPVKDSVEPADNLDLDVSLEELESLMSEDMDEPVQAVASKKQRLDRGENSTASKREDTSSSNQKKLSLDRRSQNLEHRDSEKKLQESRRMTDLEKDEGRSVQKKDRYESEDVKDEEVSFVVESKANQNGFIKDNTVAPKQEPKVSSSVSASENDADLPRKLLQVEFKSLTVSAPSRPKPGPLQSRDLNGKNFKRFRKVPVPGLEGLPNIIGGSDLVAHNRSKSSELEEWLRDAAEEEKRQEQEETLGDDLFRYNPKPSRRR